MPAISMQHDPETGGWSITTADKRHVFKVYGYPDCWTWWAWLWRIAPAEGASVLGATVDGVRSDFNTAVASVQSGCRCEPCRDAVHARQLAEINATQRTLIAGSRRRDQVALYVQGSSEPAGFVSISDPSGAARPLTYKQARTKYMDTGTITDKEAMVDCVTLTVPDLDTIGADWEPAAPKPEPAVVVPKQRASRDLGGIAVTAIGMWLVFSQTWAPQPSAVLVTMGLAFLAYGTLALLPGLARRK
jgi:hypothetical protein